MKYKKINILVLFLTLSLVLFFSLKDDFIGVLSNAKKINPFIFLLAIILVILSLFIKSLSLNTLLKNKKKQTLKETFFLTLKGHFVSGITPFQTGGQPYQIYELRKKGVRITDSTNVLIKDFISYQTALLIVCIASVIINKIFNIIDADNVITVLIYVGFLIHTAILLVFIVISFSKKTVIKLTDKLFNTKIIKNRFNKGKLDEVIENFYSSTLEFRRDGKMLVKCITINICYLIILYSIPLVIFIAFGLSNLNIIESITLTSFVTLIGNFVPLPGGTGAAEYGFVKLFSAYAKGSILSSIMLSWRFVTYVIVLIIGFIILIINKEVIEK